MGRVVFWYFLALFGTFWHLLAPVFLRAQGNFGTGLISKISKIGSTHLFRRRLELYQDFTKHGVDLRKCLIEHLKLYLLFTNFYFSPVKFCGISPPPFQG